MKVKGQQRGHSSGVHQTGLAAKKRGKIANKIFCILLFRVVLVFSKLTVTGRINFKLSLYETRVQKIEATVQYKQTSGKNKTNLKARSQT